MTTSAVRWWDLFFGVTMVVVAVMVAFTYSPTETQRLIGWGAIVVMVLAWVLVGRRAMMGSGFEVIFAAVFIAGAATIVACSPTSAIVQGIVFPILWCVLPRTRTAIIANVLLTVLLGAALWFVAGMGWDALLQAVLIEGLSLGASLGLGIWITRISDLSDERKRLLDELTATQEELAAVHRESGVSSERERLAREIHDTIAQTLTGLVMLSQQAQREAADASRVTAQLELIEENARIALVETRSLVAASAPVELNGGIAAALERLAARFRRETGIHVVVSADGCPELERDTEVVLLRCAQEGLANIRKHSRARRARLALRVDRDRVALAISDDGVGFTPQSEPGGFGLAGMRARLALVKGSLDVATSPTGTVLSVSLPVAVDA